MSTVASLAEYSESIWLKEQTDPPYVLRVQLEIDPIKKQSHVELVYESIDNSGVGCTDDRTAGSSDVDDWTLLACADISLGPCVVCPLRLERLGSSLPSAQIDTVLAGYSIETRGNAAIGKFSSVAAVEAWESLKTKFLADAPGIVDPRWNPRGFNEMKSGLTELGQEDLRQLVETLEERVNDRNDNDYLVTLEPACAAPAAPQPCYLLTDRQASEIVEYIHGLPQFTAH